MGSTFSGIELGKRSIMTHTDAITTAGHNIANAATEGYSRQRVHMKESDPLYRPDMTRPERPGCIGQGVDVMSVRRVRNGLLDGKIVRTQHLESYWEVRSDYYAIIEALYNEVDEVSVRYNMDKFWEAWQEVALNPEDISGRLAVVSRGESLADSVRARWDGLSGIAKMIDGDIEARVNEINSYVNQISALNAEIVELEALKDNPNDLLDRRDLLVDKLSKLVNITKSERDADEFMVHLDGRILVQGGKNRHYELATRVNTDGYVDVYWKDTGENIGKVSGMLGSLLELRDEDIRKEIQSLDTMVLNFVDSVNDIHKHAYGMNKTTGKDFFVQKSFVENVNGSVDTDGDGELDRTYLFRITGRNALSAKAQIGFEGNLVFNSAKGNVNVRYESTDTVEDVIAKINNSESEVKAFLDKEKKLVLKGTASRDGENEDFVIRHVADDGFFLTSYAGLLNLNEGGGGEYLYESGDAVASLSSADFSVSPLRNPSGYLSVNEDLINDASSVAVAYPDERGNINAGDGRAAVEIAAIRNSHVMIGEKLTLDDYFAASVADVGLQGERAESSFLSYKSTMDELHSLRQSISGVNIDEELSEILKFQHGYNAAAKFVSVWDEMIDVVINRLKV